MNILAAAITLILTEAPNAVELMQKLQSTGRTEASADEIAELEVDDEALKAAHDRLFPAATPPA